MTSESWVPVEGSGAGHEQNLEALTHGTKPQHLETSAKPSGRCSHPSKEGALVPSIACYPFSRTTHVFYPRSNMRVGVQLSGKIPTQHA